MKADWRFLVLVGALFLTCAATGMVIWFYPGPKEIRSVAVDTGEIISLRRQIRTKMLNRKYRDAESLTVHSIRRYPHSMPERKILGRIYFETGRPGQALELFRALRIKFPNDPVFANNIGMILLYERRFEQAVRELSNAYRLSGGRDYIAFNLYHACLLAGLKDRAVGYAAGFQRSSGSTITLPLEAILFDEKRLDTVSGSSIGGNDNIFHFRQVKKYE